MSLLLDKWLCIMSSLSIPINAVAASHMVEPDNGLTRKSPCLPEAVIGNKVRGRPERIVRTHRQLAGLEEVRAADCKKIAAVGHGTDMAVVDMVMPGTGAALDGLRCS